MSRDRLDELLREIAVPDATEARERTIAAIRAAAPGSESTAPERRAPRRRTLRVAVALALLAGGLLTPPGRAASAWVGELVGIGEVGGSPSKQERPFEETRKAVVIDNGRAPDGSRYEWVVYGCRIDLRDEGLSTRYEGFGTSLEWPGKGEGGGTCEEAASDHRTPVFRSAGVQIVPSQFRGVAAPDLVVSGETGPGVTRVEVIYRTPGGERHVLPVDFARARPDLLKRVGIDEPLGTFVAFVPGDWAARDRVEERLDLRALETTRKLKLGTLARRERRAVQRAHRVCRFKQPDPATLPNPGSEPTARDFRRLERAFAPYRACVDRRLPPSPVEIVAYDSEGKVLGRHKEQGGVQAISEPRGRLTLSPETRRRTRRPTIDPAAVGKPTVLLTGRAPEGAHYEVYVEKLAERGKPYGNCMSLWWPRVRRANSGEAFCGPPLPAGAAFGRRGPEAVHAKPFGFFDTASPATRHLLLQGFARPHVKRVRMIYKDRGGDWQDAPLKLAHIDGRLRRRAGASADFGYFVAFVPAHVARRHYGGIPPRRADGRPAVQVIAYGKNGRELSRIAHRN